MYDLISRQAAIDVIEAGRLTKLIEAEVAVNGLKALPSAQPEIIRCKNCRHWTRTHGDDWWGVGDCDVFDKHLVMCEGYCAWAERRTDANADA
ncbi:MAG: high-potential iron-sulfur protein [Bacteroidales bacterium]|nr:high-potential iron-sulfur protein [Bacteroidales bacterium]